MNMNGMNFESKRQELASRLVAREVYYCVSSLVSTLSALAQNCDSRVLRGEYLDWEEDILPLLESINYEEALRAWVMDTDGVDVQSLESAVEIDNDWDGFLEEKVWPVLGKPPKGPSIVADKVCCECHAELQGCGYEDYPTPEREVDVQESAAEFVGEYCGEEYDEEFSTHRCDCCGSSLAGARFTYEGPDDMDTQDLDDWLDADSERNEKFRELVFEQLESTSDMEELCREFQVDTDDCRDQVYEHWIVSSWLARKLKARGYVVGELCGLTIYGRTCTGQSMCLDHNMQALAIELWQEEWDEFVKSQESATC